MRQAMIMGRHIALLVLALLAAAAAGCAKTEPGTVLAKVNGAAISARDVTTRQALDNIIDRELLVQKALAAGLERDPALVQAVDDARRQLLAQAYLERMAAGVKASAEEIRAFYGDNPALFGERRIYRLRELTVSAPGEMVDVLRSQATLAKDLDDVAAWLRQRNAKFAAASLTQPAEQLPLSHLPELARMKQGEIAVFSSPLGASVVQLVLAQEAPLGEREATPVIEQFLAGRKRLELAAAEVKRLRQAAKIEYVGDLNSK